MSITSFLKGLTGKAAKTDELATANMKGSGLRDEALTKPVKELVKQLGKLPAEARADSFKTKVLDSLLAADIPPAVREAAPVREALRGAFLEMVAAKRVTHAEKVLDKINPPDAEKKQLVLAALDQEFKKRDFGMASVLAATFEPAPEEFNTRLQAAANREAKAGRLQSVCTALDHLRHYLRGNRYAGELIAVTEDNSAPFKTSYIAFLKTGKANSVAEQFDVSRFTPDPDIRNAALEGLANVLKSDSWYECFRLARTFRFTPEELATQAVQQAALTQIENRLGADVTDLQRLKTTFSPEQKALEQAILRGLKKSFEKHPYNAHTAAQAIQLVAAEKFGADTLASVECQQLGIHTLVARLCHYHASNWGENPLPYDSDKLIVQVFKLTPENQERARVQAAGRIYGCMFEHCWDVHLWPQLPDSILADRAPEGKLRDFPAFLRKLVETFDIRSFKELEHFRHENSRLMRKLAENPDEEPKQALNDLAAMKTLHISPLTAEKLLEAGVNLAALAESRDFKKLWKEIKKADKESGGSGLFEEAAELFGYERMFRHLHAWQRLEEYEGLFRFEEALKLAKVSGLEPPVFYDRVIAPALEGRIEEGSGKQSSALYYLHKTILHTAQLPEILAQYPDGALRPEIRMVTDRLVAEYPDRSDVFKGWDSFSGFVRRYLAAFDTLHYGADRPYANPPMSGISIYEANGIRPEDVHRCC